MSTVNIKKRGGALVMTTQKTKSAKVKPEVKKYVKNQLYKDIETKYLIPSGATTENIAVSSSWAANPVNLLPNSGAIEGKFATLKNLLIKGRLETADTNGNVIRIVVYRSKIPGGDTSSAMYPQQVGTTTMAPYVPWGSKKHASLVVLHDRCYQVQPDDGQKLFKINLKMNNRVTYDTTNDKPSFGDIQMAFVSDSTTAAHPTLSYVSQLSYIDQ